VDLTQISEEAFRRHIATCSVTEIERVLEDWIENSGSEPYVRLASPIAEELAARPRDTATAACLFTLSRWLAGRCRYREALAGFVEARAIYARSHEQDGVASCLLNGAIVLDGLGHYEEALADYEEARVTFARLDQPVQVARCLMNRADALCNLSRHDEALAGLDEAQAIFARFGRQTSIASCLMNRAVVLDDVSRLEEALASYEEAQTIYSSVDQPVNAARCLMNRAVALCKLDRCEEGITGYEEAQAIYARFGQKISVGLCLMNRANALNSLGRWTEAIVDYEEAQAIFIRFDRLASQVRCLLGWGKAQKALGDLEGARINYLGACEALERALTRAASQEEVVAGFRHAHPDPFLPAINTLLHQASTAQSQDREGETTIMLEQAFLLTERARSAKLREDLSRRFAADEQVALESTDAELFARWQALQLDLAKLDAHLNAGASRGGRALEEETNAHQDERARILQASETVERMLFSQNAEVAGLVSAELPALDELRRELAPDEGIVAYLLDADEDSLVTFCLDAEGVLAATAGNDPINPALEALAACVGACEREGYPAPGKGGEEADWRAVLTTLGESLLAAPAALGWLSGAKRRLTFVPSGALFALPFAALGLPGKQAYRPLIADLEVALAPQAFTRIYQKGKGEQARGAIAILNPDGSLGSSEHEAALLADALVDVEVFRGDALGSQPPLTTRTVPDLIAGRRLVHFTCHGRYEKAAPWQSKLILAGEDGAAQSQLTALQIYGRLRGSHELIFAAACESGKGTLLAGDAFIGLHRALLFRSREVLATLFKVRDDATADLERRFYHAYARNRDAVGALAAAQRAFVAATPGEDTPVGGYLPSTHPYWWAGFVVFG